MAIQEVPVPSEEMQGRASPEAQMRSVSNQPSGIRDSSVYDWGLVSIEQTTRDLDQVAHIVG